MHANSKKMFTVWVPVVAEHFLAVAQDLLDTAGGVVVLPRV